MDDLNRPSGPPTPGSEPGPFPAPERPAGFFPLRLILEPDGAPIDLNRPQMVAGRHSAADIRLHLPDVSRQHCRFVFEQGQWRLEDLESTNGVFVNEEQVQRVVLHHRDRVRLGSYVFQVDLESGQLPAIPATLSTVEHDVQTLAGRRFMPELPQRKAS
jgi:pSer/pThr/pTyr-binding forkhead associated (FHA) protein